MILFLDFDGVLHPEPCHDSPHFVRMPLLEQVLAQLPAMLVVVSSSWRHVRTFAELQASFPEALRHRVVGITPAFKDIAADVPEHLRRFQREAECWRWLQDNGHAATPWIALDDSPWLFRPLSPNVFEVDSTLALTDKDVAALLRLARSLA